MKRSTASGKTSVDVLKLRLPTEAPSDYADGVFCLKLSPQWFGIILALTDNLLIRGVWENKTDDQWSQIRRWVEEVGSLVTGCEDEPCPECPECPECPPPPPLPVGGGGAEPVGMLGLTIDELEELIMGFSLRAQLKYVNGVLCYWSDGCCDWVPVESDGAAPAPLTPAGIAALGSGTITLDDWITAGRPDLPTYPSAPHSNPAYTTPLSVTCAKATALVEQMRDNYGSLFAAFSAVAAGSATSVGIAGGVVAAALGVGTLVAFAIAVVLAGAVVAYNYTTVVEALDDIHGNDAAWDSMICSMIPEMTEGSVIQPVDVEVLYYWLRDAHNIGVDDWQYQLMRSLPIAYWQDKVQPKLIDTECRCDEYLPHNYTPPLADGLTFAFDQLAYMGNIGYGAGAPWVNQPFTGAFVSGRTGQVVGGKPRTVFTGTESTWSNSGYAAIFKLSEPAAIAKMKFVWSFTNGEQNVRVFPYYFNEADQLWRLYATDQADGSAPYVTEFEFIGGGTPDFQYFALLHKTRWATSGGVASYAQLVDVKLSGIYAGNGFMELGLGEVFNP